MSDDPTATHFLELAVYVTIFPRVVTLNKMKNLLTEKFGKSNPTINKLLDPKTGFDAHSEISLKAYTASVLKSKGVLRFDAFKQELHKAFEEANIDINQKRSSLAYLGTPEEIFNGHAMKQFELFEMFKDCLIPLMRSIATVQMQHAEKITKVNLPEHLGAILREANLHYENTTVTLIESAMPLAFALPAGFLALTMTARIDLGDFDTTSFVTNVAREVREELQRLIT
ncbi:MAG: hypothetical protein FGM57_01905 [Candidatus Taylorbacteria bacterium]|nr:hypothetical protein [Candidatus Taylorbacteria bacterium]